MASLYLYNDSILIASSLLTSLACGWLHCSRRKPQRLRQEHKRRLPDERSTTRSGALVEAGTGVMFGSTVRSAHDSQLTLDFTRVRLTALFAP